MISISISAISDLHGHLPVIPKADLTVVCGDIFPGEMDKNPDAQGLWFRSDFLPWVEKLECTHVVLIAGNHDHWIVANNDALRKEFAPEAGQKPVYLCDSGLEYRGLKIYGTPWMPTPHRNKAFSLSSDAELAEKYSYIPENVDLLLTHTVPYGCNGIGYSEKDNCDLGSKELRKAIELRNIRYLVGGHIHEPAALNVNMDFQGHRTWMYNVACCDNQKQLAKFPISFLINVE